jgi:large subunit ribosomal protein L22
MEAIAKTKYLKGSPRKARLVIDLIRGENVSRALSILKFTDKRAAQPIAQCLNSAMPMDQRTCLTPMPPEPELLTILST